MPATNGAAPRSGSTLVTCEPMWTWTATSFRSGRPSSVAKSSRAASTGTPNLLILRPVEMCGWLLRVDVGIDPDGHARRPSQPLRRSPRSRASSPADSTLIAFRPSGDGAFEFGGRLADAGEHDVVRRETRRAARRRFPRSDSRRRRCPARAAAGRWRASSWPSARSAARADSRRTRRRSRESARGSRRRCRRRAACPRPSAIA